MTRDALLRAVLRTIAVAIAIAAVIDPVMTLSRPSPRTIVLAQLSASNLASVESAIRARVPGAEVSVRPVVGGRLPCAPGESCVMVADGSVDAEVPTDLRDPVALIQLALPAGPNLAIQSAAASRTQHVAGSGMVRVVLAGSGLHGRRTELRITDGAATVGSSAHEWTGEGEVTVDVPWWPLGDGPRALRVAAAPFDGEGSAIDNAVEVGVTVSSDPVAVLVFDARPSWASTFVRRALEDDPRFRVEHRAGLAPSLSAATAGGRLDARTLDRVPVAIVGSPDALTPGDVTLFERYVGERGGTLILLPDRAPSGAAMRLFAGRWTEHLEASASAVGVLRASETLRLQAPSPFDVVLSSIKGTAGIVLSPTGSGRIVVSGAMDAWRYRDADAGAFDHYWRSLVLESAAGSAALQFAFAHASAAPGTHVPFTLRHRQMDAAPQRTVSASATCGGGTAQPLRLWPQGAPGVFEGTVAITDASGCELQVALDGGPVATAGIAVTNGATRSVSEVIRKLERAATRVGGVVGERTKVIEALASIAPPPAVPTPVYPMRSLWWMSPFVACLGIEWWLRRRAGLR